MPRKPTTTTPAPTRIYRYATLRELGVPYHDSHLRRLEADGLFPRRRKLNPSGGRGGRVGWLAAEVDAWLAALADRRTAAE